MKSFFATTTDDWDDPSGQLHAYLIPSEGFRVQAAGLTERLAAFDNLGIQTDDALHATVLRFPTMLGSLDDEDLAALAAAGNDHLRGLGELQTQWGRPQLTESTVHVAGTCDLWEDLADRVRAAARTVLGEDAERYAAPPLAHVTLAYGTGPGSRDAISDIVRAAAESGPFPTDVFDTLYWCAVHQDRDRGLYTFDIVATSVIS